MVFVVVVVFLVVAVVFFVVVAFFGCFHVASPFVLVCVRNYSQYNPEFVQSQSLFKHFQRIYTKTDTFLKTQGSRRNVTQINGGAMGFLIQ